MRIIAPPKHIIEISRRTGGDPSWVVRVFRRGLFRKRISSDWFLDGDQAQQFAEAIAAEITTGGGVTHLAARPPGWSFRQ